jgi:hypothetical protein
VHKVLTRSTRIGYRGEELFFSDAGAVTTTRSPAGEVTAPIRRSDSPEEVLAGIQGASLRHECMSPGLRSGRLT